MIKEIKDRYNINIPLFYRTGLKKFINQQILIDFLIIVHYNKYRRVVFFDNKGGLFEFLFTSSC